MQSISTATKRVATTWSSSALRFCKRYGKALLYALQFSLTVSAFAMARTYFASTPLIAYASSASCYVLCSFLQAVADESACGDQVPAREKRFTSTDSDGNVSVATEELPDMLLYVADVEDYLERRGRL